MYPIKMNFTSFPIEEITTNLHVSRNYLRIINKILKCMSYFTHSKKEERLNLNNHFENLLQWKLYQIDTLIRLEN